MKAASSRVRTGSDIDPSAGRQPRAATSEAGNGLVPGGTPRIRSSRTGASIALDVSSFIGRRSCRGVLAWSQGRRSADAIGDRPFGADAIGVLPRAQPLEGRGGGQNVAVGVAPPDQLHAD